MVIDDVFKLLNSLDCRGAHENTIQVAIERALLKAGHRVEREVRIGEAGRIDFEIPDLRLGIEVKVDGAATAVTEQLSRYAETGRYDTVMLVTTKRRHKMPDTLCGVPIRVCHLWGAIL